MSSAKSGRQEHPDPRGWKAGSVVLFALFACLAVAVCAQALSLAVLCSERALADEMGGRRRLACIDAGLAALRVRAASEWLPADWTACSEDAPVFLGRLTEVPGHGDWVLRAEVSDSVDSPLGVASALLERGRDGLDLPNAACVAEGVRLLPGRETDWLTAGDAAGDVKPGCAIAWLRRPESGLAVGVDCVVQSLSCEWTLGAGWVEALTDRTVDGSQVVVITGSVGQTVRLPEGLQTPSAERPLLVVSVGGADLELHDLGDVWGVFVADGGSLLVESTTIHGAMFAGEVLDMGLTGRLVFEPEILTWATDASLERVRLVRGTRVEATR